MINIKNLRDEIDTVQSALASRGYELDKDTFIKLEKERKILQVDVESLQSERKNLSNEFGKLKSQGEDTDKLKIKIDQINNFSFKSFIFSSEGGFVITTSYAHSFSKRISAMYFPTAFSTSEVPTFSAIWWI